jgi:hypothetical protein
VAILTEENKRLRAANARVTKKRAKKVKYLTQYESLTIQEGIEALEQPLAPQIAAQVGGGDATPKTSNRAVRHCSSCRSTEHIARTCPTLKEALRNVASTQN